MTAEEKNIFQQDNSTFCRTRSLPNATCDEGKFSKTVYENRYVWR